MGPAGWHLWELRHGKSANEEVISDRLEYMSYVRSKIYLVIYRKTAAYLLTEHRRCASHCVTIT